MTTDPDFDAVIDRRGTGCAKWDAMDKLYGVSPDEGLSMWVAGIGRRGASEIFLPPPCHCYCLAPPG